MNLAQLLPEVEEPSGPFINPSSGTWCTIYRRTADGNEYRCKNMPAPKRSVLGFPLCEECWHDVKETR